MATVEDSGTVERRAATVADLVKADYTPAVVDDRGNEDSEEWLKRQLEMEASVGNQLNASSKPLLDNGDGKLDQDKSVVVGGRRKKSRKRRRRQNFEQPDRKKGGRAAAASGTGQLSADLASASANTSAPPRGESLSASVRRGPSQLSSQQLEEEQQALLPSLGERTTNGQAPSAAGPNPRSEEGTVTARQAPEDELQAQRGLRPRGISAPATGSEAESWPGLEAPQLNSGDKVTGATKGVHRRENKRRRQAQQLDAEQVDYWQRHKGNFAIPTPKQGPVQWRGQMCPSGLALEHPAAELLLDYAMKGCPTKTGRPWTLAEIEAAIAVGPHVSAMAPDAMAQLQSEVVEKVKQGQAKVVVWDDIKDNPPEQLKVSRIAMIPHKSRMYRAILDLSFAIRLASGGIISSVNDTTEKTAPRGAIDQLGHSLMRIIHAFAQADEDAKIFMAKWDIKDGFWRLDCREGEEWNFAYVLPQEPGKPVKLVVPTSLQMGWIESPPYFCAASETGRDVAQQYVETPVGTLSNHKFIAHSAQGADFENLPATSDDTALSYLLEVYVNDYIALAVPTSREQLVHVANAVMKGVHDVFPEDEVDSNDPLSLKKMLKLEAMWALHKEILGFMFDGVEKTIWLDSAKRDVLLTTMQGWLKCSKKSRSGIPFSEFQSIISKLRHAFISIPAGKGLLSPCNGVLRLEPELVYLHRNEPLRQAIEDSRTLLRESTLAPTLCTELVSGWPDFVGVKDASKQGVGGVIVGENLSCTPTVFRAEWPDDIKSDINTADNPKGRITNSDLEMAGLLLLFLVMEEVCSLSRGQHIALFSDNQPTVHWVQRMASKSSKVAAQLLRALALRMKLRGVSPLTPLHVEGKRNAMTDIPSRSFGMLLDRVPPFLKGFYEGAFRAADEAYYNGRVAATARARQIHWRHWSLFCKTMDVDPYLQGYPHWVKVRSITGFAQKSREGYFGQGRQVQSDTVSKAVSAIGKEIALVHRVNPFLDPITRKFVPRLQEMLDGWTREDPPTMKKLPVEVDVPEFLVGAAQKKSATQRMRAVADWILIAFYFLLRIGEYAIKAGRNATKQTKQFKMEDVTFFSRDTVGKIRQIHRYADDEVIMSAYSATLKLDNQKNGWKGVCVNHEANGDSICCPVRALGRRYCHIRQHTSDMTTFMSAYFEDGERFDVTDQDVSENVKWAAASLDYPAAKGIPIDRVDTHSLRCGGANALSLAGYTDTQIQKMGRWRGKTFKEYIREELHNFSAGMSRSMKKLFGFVNIAGGAYTDVTSSVMVTAYGNAAEAA